MKTRTNQPKPIQVGKWGFNQSMPNPDQARQIAQALSHVVGHRRKHVAVASQPIGENSGKVHVFRFHTGVGARQVFVSVAIFGYLASDPSEVPRVEFWLRKPGEAYDKYREILFNRSHEDATFDQLAWLGVWFDVEPDTTYEMYFEQYERLWVRNSSIYEGFVRDSDAVVPARFVNKAPIYGDDMQPVIELMNELILKNAAHFISWSAFLAEDGFYDQTASDEAVSLRGGLSGAFGGIWDGARWEIDLSDIGRIRVVFAASANLMDAPSPAQQNAIELRNASGQTLASVGPFWDERAWLATELYLEGEEHELEAWLVEESGDTLRINGVSLYPGEQPEDSKNSADFIDGSSSFVERADGDWNGIDHRWLPWTFEAMVYAPPGSGFSGYIASKSEWSPSSDDSTFLIRYDADDTQLTVFLWNGDVRIALDADLSLTQEDLSKPFRLSIPIGIRDWDTQVVFVNGVQMNTQYSDSDDGDGGYQDNILQASDRPFRLGQRDASTSGSNSFDGELDDVRWWSKERSGSEIVGDHDRRLAPEEREDSDLLGYWTMDGHFQDLSGNGNHLDNPNDSDKPVFRGPLIGAHRVPEG